VPESLPLLVDDKFTVSNALSTTDVPNLALFDGKGHLVASKIKSLSQTLATPGGNLTAAEVLKRLASGAEFPEIKMMAPYYPATELIGHCAPEFAAKKFDTTEVAKFSGKPQAARPLLVVFWSSTCKHCQVEVPLLVSWVKRHPGKVDILSVSHIRADKEGRASHREVTRAYIKDQQIPWTVLEDPDDAVSEVYRSISTPTTYFLTPQGMVAEIWFYPHPQNFDKAMEDALGRVASMSSDTCSPAPATPAPRLALDVLTPDGKKVPLSSQLDRPALVHLWATWCAPCMEEIPAILRFGKTLESSGAGRLVMVSVEDASSGDKIAGFAKKFSLPLRSNRAPSGALAQAVDLSYRLPRTYLVARDGTVLGLRQGSQKWDDPLVEERALSRLRNAASLAR
jgi:thiol-disulfide isomerase/thioredoxin